MTLDGDGKIRMDCSSPWAMANLIALADQYDVAWETTRIPTVTASYVPRGS